MMSFPLRIRVVVLLALVLGAIWVPAPPPAAASTNQLAMLEEDVGLLTKPGPTLKTLRSLGVGVVRVAVHWSTIAPPTLPSAFKPADPAAYAAARWAPYDAIVTAAQKAGIQVEFFPSGPVPAWAAGSDQPAGNPYGDWKPSAAAYGQFVQAVGTRYSGHYRPSGASAALPRVKLWEIWSEPNWGPSLAPQEVNGRSTSPAMYRQLLTAGWNALRGTGHGHDTILIGSLSPRGFNSPGNFSTTKPMRFIRTLYCVGSNYRQLRGGAAAAVGCPTTAAGSAQFRAQNPGLFGANGFGIHPYPFSLPPTQADSRDPDYVEFNEIPRMATALDRVQRSYGSHKRLQIYNTEYGYETNPPNATDHFVSPATASVYINWAEYLSWRNPRIATTMQYLLVDPNPRVNIKVYGKGGFASGLIFFNGKPKADYNAYRMPIFLPVTSTTRGRALEVWGCVRPAHYASADTHGRKQRVQIQFRQGSRGSFRTVATVTVRSARGYFDVRQKFSSSGAVRLAWRYPSGQQIYSRVVNVKVR
jgi:hypothetical protein